MTQFTPLEQQFERQPLATSALRQAAHYALPDARGHFGPYGGSFVAETLTPALTELKDAYARYQRDPEFVAEFERELKHFVGRPSPVYHAKRWSEQMGGAQIYFKREDLNHTGAHKINNVIGQALLAKRMGKPRVIAETGAGQHGVATATICARFGMECVVYMGSEDVKRQVQNVYRMKLLGRQGGAGRIRLEDAEGCAERSDARLGHQRRKHLLHHRHRGRAASVSDDGARFPVGDRHRMPDADAGNDRAPAGLRGRLRRRRLECDGDFLSVHRLSRGATGRRGGGRRRHRHRPALGLAVGRLARRPARQPHLPAAGRERPDQRNPLGLGRAGLSRRRPRARLAEGQRARAVRLDHRRRGAGRVQHLLPHRRHHPGAGIEPCAGARGQAGGDPAARTKPSW